ncbi:unnamed protein product [Nezara viridula]|uniref:tRNA(His) guanylyltransferase n=1 Tax=Nezara viridula TaxID=85310 RepID=A0A9P0H5M5_NEZVI|nr:unnamed protein product [Nezara viridula]
MAKSKFEYVRYFEQENKCLKNCWIVVRIDGKNFHRFTEIHEFDKPNDINGLNLMSNAAVNVLREFSDINLAFGHSDEFSFVFKKKTNIFNRRSDKILSLVNSIFSSSFVFLWNKYFPNKQLIYAPAFDARIVLYPTDQNLRDYFSWRQADVHVNNLYNTCFWALVLKMGLSPVEAEEKLRGTLSSAKNELLYKNFDINYNNEPEIFRKGTVLVRKCISWEGATKPKSVIIPLHCDIIKDDFWNSHPEILDQSETPLVDKLKLDHYFVCEQKNFKM